jgi:hypothetical protein
METTTSLAPSLFGMQGITSGSQHQVQQQSNISHGHGHTGVGHVQHVQQQLGAPSAGDGGANGMQQVQQVTPPTPGMPVQLPAIDLISASDPSAALAPHRRQQFTRALLTAIQAVFGSNTSQLLAASSRLTQLQPLAMVEFLQANYEVLRMAVAMLPDPGMTGMARRLLASLLGLDMSG